MRTIDRRIIFGTRLSDNISMDGNGQLIAHNVVIARTGEQVYLGREFNPKEDPNKKFTIDRLPEHVFNPEFMASFENVPFTDSHPQVDVSPDNHARLAKGFVKDVYKGHLKLHGLDKRFYDEDGNNVLYADVVITDKMMIKYIQDELKKAPKDRKIDVSCGYDAEYIKVSDDRYVQIGRNGNHVALVPVGRAKVAKIRDAATESVEIKHDNKYFEQRLPYEYDGGFKQTGISGYKLVIMSPQEYFDELVYKAKTHYEQDVVPTDEDRINSMITHMGSNGKFEIPYIVYCSEGDNYQDGRHRAEAAKRMGIQTIPVLIFYRSKEDEMVEVVVKDGIGIANHKGFVISSKDTAEFTITKDEKYVTLVKAKSFDAVATMLDEGSINTKDFNLKIKGSKFEMHGFSDKKEAKEFAVIVHEQFS